MSNNGFTGKQFQTAAFRRRGRPLVFRVEGWVTTDDEMAAWLEAFDAGEPPDAGPGHEVVVTLLVDPLLDIVRLGAAFGSFGETLKSFGDDTPTDDKIALLDRELPKVKAALRQCLVPPSRIRFDEVSAGMDVRQISELVRWMTQELSGLDPTPPTSLSTGSDATGNSSTAGAPPEASTSAVFPSPVP